MSIEREFTDEQIKILKPLLKDFKMDRDNVRDRNVMISADAVICLMPSQKKKPFKVFEREGIIVYSGSQIIKSINILERLGDKAYYFQTYDGASPIRLHGEIYEICIAPRLEDKEIKKLCLEDYVVKEQ